MIDQERAQAAQKRINEIKETIKELRAYGSDIARAKRAIAREQAILEGVSRKRDPIPWAISQLRLASALSVIAGKAGDISKLRKAFFRLEKARRVFEHAGHQDAAQKCEALQAEIKKILTRLGDEKDPFDPGLEMGGHNGGLDSQGRDYADDLAERLRQAAGNIDRKAATRSVEQIRQAREADELARKRVLKDREQERQRARSVQRERDDDRDWDR